jgi:ADP-ribosylglycohydrolase
VFAVADITGIRYTAMSELQDRVAGVLLGLAAGDRIGGPVRMALHVAESLIEHNGFDSDDIAKRYLEWWGQDAFDTGPTAARVLALVESGVTWGQASEQIHAQVGSMTAGCNPAHRSAPLAMAADIEDSRLEEAARAECCLTHRHPLAADVAVAVVSLCRALIRGSDWANALRVAEASRLEETRQAFAVGSGACLSQGGYAPDVLRAALYFIDAATSFRDALEAAIAFAGPANYCPVLVGSIGGARWGCRHIEERLLVHHAALRPRLQAAATALTQGW